MATERHDSAIDVDEDAILPVPIPAIPTQAATVNTPNPPQVPQAQQASQVPQVPQAPDVNKDTILHVPKQVAFASTSKPPQVPQGPDVDKGAILPVPKKVVTARTSKPQQASQVPNFKKVESAEVPPEVDDVPAGMRQMEAILSVWTLKWMVVAYVLITLIGFVNSLQQNVDMTFKPYVTSDVGKHNLTTMVNLVATIISGVSKLPLGQFINICGRPHGFAVCLGLVVMALVIMAGSQNIATYATAQVFFWTGMNGIVYIIDVFIADTSLLKTRMIWFSIAASPIIITTFAGPKLGEGFIKHASWRVGYGLFAIITPVICAPFWITFWFMNKKGINFGVVQRPRQGWTFCRSFRHWFFEYDVFGVLLLCAGLTVLLVPFGIVKELEGGWKSVTIGCMIPIGLVMLGFFGVWEYFWAYKRVLPFHLMKDRSIVGSCLLAFTGHLAFHSYRQMYTSYLQVVFDFSVAKAGYITNIHSLVSAGWAVIIAIIFRWTDTYKWAAVVAVPIQIAMTGCLVRMRLPGTPLAPLVIVEVFYAIAAGTLVQVETLSIMAAVPQREIPIALAFLFMATSIGGAVGQTVSAAIWNHVVPDRLLSYLPEGKKHMAGQIYASLRVQMKSPMGSPEREATIAAYVSAQKVMVMVTCCCLMPCMVLVFLLRNIRLSHHRRDGSPQV